MKTSKFSLVFLFLLLGLSISQGQNSIQSNFQNPPTSGWISKSNFTRSNSFVENAGQFKEIEGTNNKGILFQLEDNSMLVSFTKTGVTYLIFKQEKATEREWEKFARKNHIVSEEKEEEEKDKAKYITKNAIVEMNWVGSNTNPQIVSEDATNFYHNYYSPIASDLNKVIGNVKGFKKITYKNIYPFIDIEYTIHPKEGLKYSYILHPGADPSMIKMHYTGADAKLDNDHNIIFKTNLGNITDHAPLTYKSDDASAGKIINSEFEFLDKNTIGFKFQNSDKITETTIIDPWQVGPSFPANGFTPNDVSVDGSGNVLVYSIKPPPFLGSASQRIDKYNSAGVLQWTFDLDANAAYGSFQGDVAADPAGNVYACIGLGQTGTTYYNTIKINPAGTALLWGTSTGGTGTNQMYETWTITFNCNYSSFYQSGGGRLIGGTTYFNVSVEEPVNSATGAEGTVIENDSVGEIICTYYAPNSLVYHMAADSNNVPTRTGATGAPSTGVHNTLFCFNPATGTRLFKVNTPYSYVDGDMKAPSSIGINGMVSSCLYLYTTNGAKLDRWNPTTGAHYNQISIPGGSTTAGAVNSGLLTDKCGNVYVGGNGKIYEYDPLLNLINTFSGLPGVVFDMAWTNASNTDIVVCGGTSNTTTFLADIAIPACVLPNQVTITPVQPTCSALGTATATATFCGAPYTYSWSNGQTTQTATGLGAGTYTVTVSSSVSCPYSYVETQTVVINPVPGGPTVTVNNPPAICVGQSATLTATPSAGGGTYLWAPGGQTTPSITVSPGATTAYTVTYTLAGCSTTGTGTVTVNTPPVLTITNPPAVCAPGTVDITAAAVTAGSTGAGTLTYWTDAAATSALALPNAVATSGTYYIQSAVGTCKDIKPVTVTINSSPVLTITNPASVCAPGSVNLTAAAVTAGSTGGGALTYWTDAAATSALASPNNVTTSGTYYIQSTLGACKDIKPVTVNISPAPVLTITNPAAVCAPNTVDLTAAAVTAGSTGAGTLTYWTDAAATSALASPNAVATSGTYYIQSAVGTCKDIKPVTVTINPSPVLTITNPASVCAPGSVNLTAAAVTAGSTGGGALTYWTDAAATSALASPNNVTTSGTYYIQSTLGTCKDIKPVTVNISPAPVLTITNPAAVCAPGTVDITAAAVTAGSTGAGTLTYWTDAAATSALASPNAVATSGTYYIQSAVGTCKDIKPVTVTINPKPTLVITNPAAVCAPGTVDITLPAVTAGSTAGTLSYWTDAAATSALASPNAITTSGTYYIKTTTAAGCTDIKPVNVTISPAPVLTITNPAAVCAPGTVDITAAAVTAGSTGAGTLTYWTDAAATFGLASPNAVATSGTYYIQSAVGTCKDIKPVTVTITPKPTLVITDPSAVCAPGTVDITAAAVTAGSTAGTLSYWTDVVATSSLASPNAIGTSGTYYIKVTTAAGCSDIKPVNVTINPKPTLVITDPAAVCAPGTVDITPAAVTAGSTAGTLSYWTDVSATSSLASPNAVGTSGTYYIKVTTAAGCTDVKPVIVTISPAPVLTITNPAGVCSPTTVDITAAAITAGSTGSGILTYWTDPAATNPLASPNAVSNSATYYIVSTVGSCKDSKPVTVIINSTPVLNITDPAAVCSPGTIDITAAAVTAGSTGGGTLTYWTDVSATTALASPNAVANSGTYYIKTTTAAGCFDVKPVIVTINALPVLTITDPAAVCSPGTIDITIPAVTAGSTGGGTLTYWTDISATTSLASPTMVGTSGTYYIKTTTAAGCKDIKPVNVTINPKPSLVITNPPAVCAPNTVDIAAPAVTAGSTGAGTLTYWNDAAASSALSSPNAVATSGTYYIKTTTAAGCTDIQGVLVTINPLPVLVITDPNPVCQGNTINITAPAVTSGSTGLGALSYWTDAAATAALASPNALTTSGTYYIKTTSAAGCADVKPVTIVINPKPSPAITSGPTSGCDPLCVNFTDASTVSSGTITGWSWNFGDASAPATASGQNPSHCYTAGTYTVTITDTTDAGCIATSTIPYVITVHPNPVASFSAPLATSILSPTIQYTDESTIAAPGQIVNWHWNFGDIFSTGGTDTALQNPSHTFSDVGTYCADLIVTSNKGCKDTFNYCIVIDPEFTFFIPNAFSPNDDGINDEFFGKGDFIKTYEMIIYDRWGNMIFYTDDINKHWNGKANNGAEVAQQDVYVYVVKLSDNKDKKHKYLGTVTIVK